MASEREQDQTFMLERRTGDWRNDVELNLGGIVRHVDLEIESFTSDISLYFAFTTAVAKAADAVVSLFRVKAPFFGLIFFFFFLLCVVVLLLRRCEIWLWISCAFFWIFCVAVDGVDGSGI